MVVTVRLAAVLDQVVVVVVPEGRSLKAVTITAAPAVVVAAVALAAQAAPVVAPAVLVSPYPSTEALKSS